MKFEKSFKAFLVGFAFTAVSQADVVRNPLDYGVFEEYGSIFNSQSLANQTNPTPSNPDRRFTLSRTTGWFMQDATINQRLDLKMGMAALLFGIYPDVGGNSAEQPYAEQLGGAALIQATGAYTWGDLKNPAAKLTLGYMQYKYNEDAQDLGEYLFKSTPYPSTTINSSWDLEGAARARITGGVLTANAFNGMWKNDILLTISSIRPQYDLSPAYVTSVKIPGTHDMLELGAGVNFYHLIQNKSSLDSPDPSDAANFPNNYFQYNGQYYSENSSYYRSLASNIPGSAAYYNGIAAHVDSLNLRQVVVNGDTVNPNYSGYTAAGTLLMGRFSLNFKPVLGENVDLKLYGEASILGVKDYPVFYNKMMNRVPMMLGLNIPTFGILDFLNVEGEYWNNPYSNVNTVISDGFYSLTGVTPNFAYYGVSTNNVHWSVTAKKSLLGALSVTGKVAKDHLTQIAVYDGLGSEEGGDILWRKGWYYVLRLDVAI